MFPEILRVRGRCGAMETTQDQVMVCVVSCVLDHHVLEQTEVCNQDVVGPGAHLLFSESHASRLAVLQTKLVSWEEVTDNVFKPRSGQG